MVDGQGFYQQICDFREAGKVIHLAEKPEKKMAVVLDLNLMYSLALLSTVKRSDDTIPPLYSQRAVKGLVQIVQEVLKKKTVVKDPKALTCCVLEKKTSYVVKDDPEGIRSGFHLHFPFTLLDLAYQNVIREEIVRLVEERKVFSSH